MRRAYSDTSAHRLDRLDVVERVLRKRSEDGLLEAESQSFCFSQFEAELVDQDGSDLLAHLLAEFELDARLGGRLFLLDGAALDVGDEGLQVRGVLQTLLEGLDVQSDVFGLRDGQDGLGGG